jgi:tetratricopeptide (TPR) repeat protein
MPDDQETVRHGDAADPARPEATTVGLPRGAHFGRYTILEEIGVGGMGTVYAAYDPVLDRKVALKVLNSEVTDPDASQRLLREAQAMARLNHPNVVSVHDAGTHDGQPFVAMEFVEGSNLGVWLGSEERPWQDIVESYVAAGDGLAAAHAAGLVHRDFKPSNVMVGDDGRVRVSDFGLARPPQGGDWETTVTMTAEAVETEIDEDRGAGLLDTPLTRDGTILGTPAFMAPEQVLRAQADQRSDQFSFCVSLYVSLFRQHPFGPFVSSDAWAVRAVQGEIEPPPAGSPVPARIQAAILRGLSGNPQDRFPGMDDLLTVLRFNPRHTRQRWMMGVLAAVALAVAAAGISHWVIQRRQLCSDGEARIAAVWNPARAQQLEQIWVQTAGEFGREAARALDPHMQVYASSWARIYREACEATHFRGERSEALLDRQMACLTSRMREADHLLTLIEAGDRELVSSAMDAVLGLHSPETCADTAAMVERLPRPTEPEARATLEELEADMALAEAERLAGQYEDCLTRLQELVPAAREIEYAPVLAEVLVLKGFVEADLGQAEDAEASLLEAVAAAERGRDDHAGAMAASNLMWVNGYLGGRFDEAFQWGEFADAKVARLGGHDLSAADIADARATVLLRAGRYAEAREVQERSLELQRRVSGPDSLDYAMALSSMGNVLSSIGEFEAAVDHYRESLVLKEHHVGPEHPTVATTLASLAQAYGELERPEEMLAVAERALAIQEHAFGDDHPQLAVPLNNLAYALEDVGRYEEARAAHERSMEIVSRSWGPQHPQLAYALLNLSSLEKKTGDYQAALDASRRAGEILIASFGPDHPIYAYAANNTGVYLMLTGHPSEAVPHLEKALAIRSSVETDPVLLEVTRFNLGRALWEAGQRRRGHGLVREAGDKLAEAGEHAADDLEAVQVWLAEH